MNTSGDKKGLVLVAVLWLVVVLMAIVATVGRNSRLDTKVRLVRMEELRCKWACRAGIETAIGVLNEDTRESESLTDLWSDNDTDFNNVALEDCYFTVRVVDEASKLNINTVTREQLLALPYMVEDIADAIIDWRDNDDTPSQAGAEGGYYENLPFGYMIRNGPFRTIRELLLVKGVTEEMLFGEDTNLNGELDYNERDGDESPPLDDRDDELDEGWIAYLTCYSVDTNKDAQGQTRVNINQADERRLESSLGLKQSQARWIVENRQKQSNSRYESIGHLIDNSSPREPRQASPGDSNEAEPLDLQTFYQIADRITVNSDGQAPGRVNINTASLYVLAALSGGGDQAEQTAESIIAHRETLMYGMESIAELLESGVVNIDTFRQIANYITTRSDIFTIRCMATADRNAVTGTKLQTEAVVNRSSTPVEILYWYQGAIY